MSVDTSAARARGAQPHTVVVIGAGMAGVRGAEALRAQGFGGRIVLLGDEPHLPYDRPPLSKAYLLGKIEPSALSFHTAEQLRELRIEFQVHAAVRLDPAGRRVIADDTVIDYDRAVIATGAVARPVAGVPARHQPMLLRTLDDAKALRGALERAHSVVVIGGGLIGCEIAATARGLGLAVTLVEPAPTLMTRSLGRTLGALAEDLHRGHGVDVLTGTSVVSVTAPHAEVDPVWRVELADGRALTADLVVAGIGADPATGWLAGSGIAVDDGVLCDATLTTSDPDVMAVGDVARYLRPDGRHLRTEQWLSAVDQARHVAANIVLPHHQRAPFGGSDYFWTQQYGRMIQGVGSVTGGDLTIARTGGDQHDFLARALRPDGTTAGVFACGYPREFAKARRELAGSAR